MANPLKLGFITLFPEAIEPYLGASIMGRASAKGLVSIAVQNPRDFTYDVHRKVDDTPYGGEPGMLMRPEPIRLALSALIGHSTLSREDYPPHSAVIVTEPGGQRLTQSLAREFALLKQIVVVCGHYEGIDHRFEARFATHVVSIGDFVLTGGELPALVIADAVTRLIPGVLGSSDSLTADSFADGSERIAAPNYTRPAEWLGDEVPAVLRSGDHAAIARWRAERSAELTDRHAREGESTS